MPRGLKGKWQLSASGACRCPGCCWQSTSNLATLTRPSLFEPDRVPDSKAGCLRVRVPHVARVVLHHFEPAVRPVERVVRVRPSEVVRPDLLLKNSSSSRRQCTKTSLRMYSVKMISLYSVPTASPARRCRAASRDSASGRRHLSCRAGRGSGRRRSCPAPPRVGSMICRLQALDVFGLGQGAQSRQRRWRLGAGSAERVPRGL